MAIYGVIYAVLENDCRRLLAYHIVSQVGYMVAGIGIGTEMALNGAASHAFAHILYKALLFMGAGAVIYVTGRRKLTELGGLYRAMPLTVALYMVGAFAISAFPFFSGFVTKSMVVAAAGRTTARGGAAPDHGVVGNLPAHRAEAPYYMFFGKDAGLAAREPPRNMLIAMGLAAVLCIAIGVFPGRSTPCSHPVDFEPYTGACHREPRHPDVHRARLRAVPEGARPREHHQPRHRLVLPQGRAGVHVARPNPLARYEKAVSEVSETAALPFLHAAARTGLMVDLRGVDAVVNGIARSILRGGATLRRLQTGVRRLRGR